MRILFGLKVWSTNLGLIPKAILLHEQGELDYVEIFCVPGSYDVTAQSWVTSNIPAIVHAPHSLSGLNFSLREMETRNAALAEESLRMADALGAGVVIFHPGSRGSIEETIRQIWKLRDSRMILENKPYLGLDGSTCVGSTPDELSTLTRALGIGFCLDFGHAIAASNSHGVEASAFIARFLTLDPVMYHLTDGDYRSEEDHHDRYGEGDFPLRELIGCIPDGTRVTDEAKRRDPNSLEDYVQDRIYAESILGGGCL